MKVPTINIVMSFDPEEIYTFLSSKTLNIFKDKSKNTKDTYFFRNGPASSFKSLTHSVGYEGEDGTPSLSIEFIDPQDLFEHRMASFTVKGMMPEDANLIEDQLKKLRQKKYDASNAILLTNNKIAAAEKSLKDLQANDLLNDEKSDFAAQLKALIKKSAQDLEFFEAALEGAIEDLDAAVDTDILDKGVIDDEDFSELDAETRATVREYNESIFKRNIWISYGVGDILENWCPPMVYANAIGAEYSVGGTNARVLKLKYDGVADKPSNTTTSNFLKKLGARTVCKGTSKRLLNSDAMEARKNYYDALNSNDEVSIPYFKSLFGYSIHEVITDVLSSYIRNASHRENVLVLVPDLDKVLKDKYDTALTRSDWRTRLKLKYDPKFSDGYKEMAQYLGAMTGFFEDLGMQVTETRMGVQFAGLLALQNLEKEANSPDEVKEYLETNEYHVNLTSNIGQDNHLDALETVTKAIHKASMSSFKTEDTPKEGFEFKEYVINDFIILKALSRKGLIPTASEPLYVYGTERMVTDFLFGQIAFRTESGAISSSTQLPGKTVDESTLTDYMKGELANRVSPLDIAKGLDATYIKTMAHYQDPSLAFSPFGFDSIRTNAIDVEVDDRIKNKFTTPIFSIGTQNANVINLKLDYNKQYLAALSSIKYEPDTRDQKLDRIIDDTQISGKINDLFGAFTKLDIGQLESQTDPGWSAFKKLVDPYRDNGWWGWDDIEDEDTADALLEVFEELNSDFAETLKDALSSGGGDDEGYYDLMLESLLGMSSEHPVQQVTTPVGSDGSVTVAHTANLFAKLKKMAIIGTVKTLPLFQLSSMKRTINKPCFVYALEPRFQGVKRDPNAFKDNGTIKGLAPFYTGQYVITGFKHTISGNSAHSEFKINKAGVK